MSKPETPAEWLRQASPDEREQVQRRREKSDRDSAKMAEKLMQGWCMLNQCCSSPDCAVS